MNWKKLNIGQIALGFLIGGGAGWGATVARGIVSWDAHAEAIVAEETAWNAGDPVGAHDAFLGVKATFEAVDEGRKALGRVGQK